MKCRLKNINMYEMSKENDKFKVFKDTVSYYSNLCNYLSNNDITDLNNKDFFDIVNSMYTITIDEYDLLGILSIKNNRNYSEIKDIYIKKYNETYKTVVYSMFKIPDALSKDRYEELLMNKDIVCISSVYGNLIKSMNLNTKEDIVNYIKSDLNSYTKLIRSYLSKRRLLEASKEIAEELKKDINDYLSYLKVDDPKSFQKCTEWFKKENCKKDISIYTKKKSNK